MDLSTTFPVVFGLLGVGPQEIWLIVEDFLDALCKPVGDEIPWQPANRSDSSTEALLRRVAALAGHPVRAIDWGVRQVLRHALTDMRTAEVTARLIAENSIEASTRTEALLAVIASAGPLPSTAIAILRDTLTATAHVKDQILRDIAQLAAAQMGIALQPRGRRPLRLSYSLATPPVPSHHVPDTDDDGVQILDPTNPRSSLGTYDDLLEGPISDLSGIGDATLIRQAELLGKQAAERDPWTCGGIKAHAERIKHSGWLHSYRPWPLMVGRRGAAAIVAELADARSLPDPAPLTISERLGLIDPPLDLAEPEALPASVSRPARRSRFAGQRGTWTADTAEAAQIYEETRSNEEIILGEWADWTELSWDQARERRVSVAHRLGLTTTSTMPEITAAPQPGDLRRLEKLMNLDLFRSSTAYRISASGVVSSTSPSDLPLVVGGQEWWSETSVHQWLALAPELGRHLGWNLSDEGRFEWRDDTGERMAWSRWWIQCLDTHQPPHFHDDAGEGWQVLVTHAGWSQISAVLGALEVSAVVARAGTRNADWEQIARDTRKLASPQDSITGPPLTN